MKCFTKISLKKKSSSVLSSVQNFCCIVQDLHNNHKPQQPWFLPADDYFGSMLSNHLKLWGNTKQHSVVTRKNISFYYANFKHFNCFILKVTKEIWKVENNFLKYCLKHFLTLSSEETITSNTLTTWCEELTHQKRPWCWERLEAGREGDKRGCDGWIASLTWWTWVWESSGSW